ncbi:sulfurtransferase TusA family protein [Elstera cyanobacteriorum]|uniref:sulfurtransferase TusA family protein n=1 Tax=Elstera cyanobacteriorum TaxID=2022747 RepID=UPI003B5B9F55
MNSFSDQPLIVDCTGMRCPLPILHFRKAARAAEFGKSLLLLSDDPNTHRDFAAFCHAAGHVLVAVEEQAGRWQFLVQLGCAAETGGE